MRRVVLASMLLLFSAGCGRYAVRPDEKEYLADRVMQPDYDAMEVSAISTC